MPVAKKFQSLVVLLRQVLIVWCQLDTLPHAVLLIWYVPVQNKSEPLYFILDCSHWEADDYVAAQSKNFGTTVLQYQHFCTSTVCSLRDCGICASNTAWCCKDKEQMLIHEDCFSTVSATIFCYLWHWERSTKDPLMIGCTASLLDLLVCKKLWALQWKNADANVLGLGVCKIIFWSDALGANLSKMAVQHCQYDGLSPTMREFIFWSPHHTACKKCDQWLSRASNVSTLPKITFEHRSFCESSEIFWIKVPLLYLWPLFSSDHVFLYLIVCSPKMTLITGQSSPARPCSGCMVRQCCDNWLVNLWHPTLT